MIILHGVVLTLLSLSSSEAALPDAIFRKSLSDGFRLQFNCDPTTIETYWKSLSIACAEVLTTQNFTTTGFQGTARGLCVSCGKPLYELVRACVDESGRLLHSLDVLCATNDEGEKCYDAVSGLEERGGELFSDCERSPCSAACKRDLEASNDQHGCCVFSSVALLSDKQTAEQLWSRCDVDVPNLCTGAFAESIITPDASPDENKRSAAAMSSHQSVIHVIFIAYTVFCYISTIF